MSRGWAVEGASPYNSEITASPEHGRTMFAPTDVCGIIKGCEINNNAKCQRGVGGADFVLRYYIYIKHNFCVLFLIKSAPSRLSPIEALPQTSQGTLSLDPASPLTPGLSLRLSARYARCLSTSLFSFAHSSLLSPHSSFLTPHSSFLTPHSSFLT